MASNLSEKMTRATHESVAGPGRTSRHVLAIDDDEKLLHLYDEFLTSRGFRVTTCHDSVQVVPLLKQQIFDAVLLDIRMPGLEGTDLLPLIKRLHPKLPVILISGYGEDANLGYYHTLGAREFVSKPFTPELLIDTVRRALDEEEHIPFVITSFSLRDARDQVYRKVMLAALRKTNWNQVKAAELMRISRYCLMRWMKKLGISC